MTRRRAGAPRRRPHSFEASSDAVALRTRARSARRRRRRPRPRRYGPSRSSPSDAGELVVVGDSIARAGATPAIADTSRGAARTSTARPPPSRGTRAIVVDIVGSSEASPSTLGDERVSQPGSSVGDRQLAAHTLHRDGRSRRAVARTRRGRRGSSRTTIRGAPLGFAPADRVSRPRATRFSTTTPRRAPRDHDDGTTLPRRHRVLCRLGLCGGPSRHDAAATRRRARRDVGRPRRARPPYVDVFERRGELVERVRAEQRAHFGRRQRRPVVDRAAIAEPQQPGAEPQPHRALEIAVAFGGVGRALERRGILARAARCRGRHAVAGACLARRRLHDRTTMPAIASPTIASPISEPDEPGHEARTRRRSSAPTGRAVRRATATARGTGAAPDRSGTGGRRGCRATSTRCGVRIDGLRRGDHAGIVSGARPRRAAAIIICTSNASARMRRSKYRATTARGRERQRDDRRDRVARRDCAITSARRAVARRMTQPSAGREPALSAVHEQLAQPERRRTRARTAPSSARTSARAPRTRRCARACSAGMATRPRHLRARRPGRSTAKKPTNCRDGRRRASAPMSGSARAADVAARDVDRRRACPTYGVGDDPWSSPRRRTSVVTAPMSTRDDDGARAATTRRCRCRTPVWRRR